MVRRYISVVSIRSLTGPLLPIRPDNVQAGMVIDELLIPSRYCGPPRSANGGYTAGSLAHVLTGTGPITATVRLQQPPPLDRTLYWLRYRVECFFHDLKRFRAAATRYDKTATCYLAVLHVASMLLWLR
ncbi:MAG: hypothetical protein EOO74_08820 [Myxococcales bacterium]|nr:MAG: hypothetical protein EOO74_08820 [Myxococcales bacterium]